MATKKGNPFAKKAGAKDDKTKGGFVPFKKGMKKGK